MATKSLPTIFLAGNGSSIPEICKYLCNSANSLYRLKTCHELLDPSSDTPL